MNRPFQTARIAIIAAAGLFAVGTVSAQEAAPASLEAQTAELTRNIGDKLTLKLVRPSEDMADQIAHLDSAMSPQPVYVSDLPQNIQDREVVIRLASED